MTTLIQPKTDTTEPTTASLYTAAPQEGQFSLPNEIWLKIFNEFSHDELVNMRQVCRYWKQIADDQILWKKFFEPFFYVAPSTDFRTAFIDKCKEAKDFKQALTTVAPLPKTFLNNTKKFSAKVLKVFKQYLFIGSQTKGLWISNAMQPNKCAQIKKLEGTPTDIGFCQNRAIIAMENGKTYIFNVLEEKIELHFDDDEKGISSIFINHQSLFHVNQFGFSQVRHLDTLELVKEFNCEVSSNLQPLKWRDNIIFLETDGKMTTTNWSNDETSMYHTQIRSPTTWNIWNDTLFIGCSEPFMNRGNIVVWDLAEKKELRKISIFPQKELVQIIFQKYIGNHTFCLTGAEDGEIKVWDPHTWICLTSLNNDKGIAVESMVIWNRCLLASFTDGTLYSWDFNNPLVDMDS